MAQPYQPQSFYETTLVAAITATQSTIAVTVAPTITSGYLVIEANTSNREIIRYMGVTGTTLTGCVRGLAEYGSNDGAGTGKAHPAGVDIANKDVHFYFAQYYDFLTGTSATGANIMRIGDGAAVSSADRYWYVNTSSVSAFWGLNSSGQMVVSEDGVTSYVISAGGSGVAGSNSIDITAGVASVKSISASALYLSASGLRVSATKLAVNAGQGLAVTSASELYFDNTYALSSTGANTFYGNNTFSGQAIGIDTLLFDADEVIVVSSHPKPVKLTSAGRVYMCSADSVTHLDPYIGFCITAASAAGTQVQVKTKGLVPGFSGLTTGDRYMVEGPAGEIESISGVSAVYELQLGVAASANQILIQKGYMEYMGTAGVSADGSAIAPAGARYAIINASLVIATDTLTGSSFVQKFSQIGMNIVFAYGSSSGTRTYESGVSWNPTTNKLTFGTSPSSGTVYFYR